MMIELSWEMLKVAQPFNGTLSFYTVVNGNVSRVAFVSKFPAMAFEIVGNNPAVSAFLAVYPESHQVQKIEV